MGLVLITIAVQLLFGLLILGAFVYVLIDQINRNRKKDFSDRDN